MNKQEIINLAWNLIPRFQNERGLDANEVRREAFIDGMEYCAGHNHYQPETPSPVQQQVSGEPINFPTQIGKTTTAILTTPLQMAEEYLKKVK